MLGRICGAAALFFAVQRRGGFPQVYLATTLVTLAICSYALDGALVALLTPAILLLEPGLMGLTLTAAQTCLDRDQRCTTALAVTPLRSDELVVAVVVTSALTATLAGVVLQAGLLGIDTRLLWLAAPLFLTATFAGFLGVGLAMLCEDFTRFLIYALTPVMLLLALPMLSYFEIVPRSLLLWIPTDASLFAFANVSLERPQVVEYGIYLALLVGYNAAARVWATRVYVARERGPQKTVLSTAWQTP